MKVYVVIDGDEYQYRKVVAVCASQEAVDTWALSLPLECIYSEAEREWFICCTHPEPGYDHDFGWHTTEEEARAAMRDPATVLATFTVEEWDVRD